MNKKNNVKLLLSAIISSVLFGCNSGGTNNPSDTTNMSKANSNVTATLTGPSNNTNPSSICNGIPAWNKDQIYAESGTIVSYLGKE